MDCFPDFCLGCDSQAVDGLYCSEACRMSDLERSRSCSTPSTPTGSPHYHAHTSSHFSFDKASPPTNSTSSSSRTSSHSPPASSRHTSRSASPRRILSPSSSRSSLLSDSGQSPPVESLTQEAAKELQNFFSSFDRTRWERRKSATPDYVQWTTLFRVDHVNKA